MYGGPLLKESRAREKAMTKRDVEEFTAIPEAAPIHRRGQPFGNYDFSKPSRLVIAYGGHGDGIIMWAVGGHFAVFYDMNGGSLEVSEYGLDYTVDAGIYVWEGHILDTSTDSPINGRDYDCELQGELREPTEAEWDAIKAGNPPWDDQDYKLATPG